jgi:hypothetical protein
MRRPARFRVVGRFDIAGGVQEATVTVDGNGMFKVRPLRRHRSYDLTLAAVAAIVCQRIIAVEVREKRAARKARRRRIA